MARPSATTSSAVALAGRLSKGSWKIIWNPLRSRRSVRPRTRVMSTPPIDTAPDVASSSRMIVRAMVVLPQPDSPTSATISRSRISRSTPSTARGDHPSATVADREMHVQIPDLGDYRRVHRRARLLRADEVAGRVMSRRAGHRSQPRIVGGALRHHHRAALVEPAAGRRRGQIGRTAGDPADRRVSRAEPWVAVQQPAGVRVRGAASLDLPDVVGEYRGGRTVFDDTPRIHHRGPVAQFGEHGQVVRDDQHRQPELVGKPRGSDRGSAPASSHPARSSARRRSPARACRPTPSRSSRAVSSRRRTDAGSQRPGRARCRPGSAVRATRSRTERRPTSGS